MILSIIERIKGVLLISNEKLTSSFEKLKKSVDDYIESEQLLCVMNNTKWDEFRNAMIHELPFAPPYIIKTIFEVEDDSLYFTHFNNDVGYLGAYDDESFEYLQYNTIEWIKIRPRYYKEKGGRLISKKEFIDCESEFLDILKKYNIPYEHHDNLYIIYGYKRT